MSLRGSLLIFLTVNSVSHAKCVQGKGFTAQKHHPLQTDTITCGSQHKPEEVSPDDRQVRKYNSIVFLSLQAAG